MATSAPAAAKRLAIVLPRPREAPVTSTLRLVKLDTSIHLFRGLTPSIILRSLSDRGRAVCPGSLASIRLFNNQRRTPWVVHVKIDYPQAEDDVIWRVPLVKWLVAIPRCIEMSILGMVALVLIVLSWFAVLFAGRYQMSLVDLVVAVMNWGHMEQAWAFL